MNDDETPTPVDQSVRGLKATLTYRVPELDALKLRDLCDELTCVVVERGFPGERITGLHYDYSRYELTVEFQ